MDVPREMFERLKQAADESIRVNEGTKQAMDAALRAPEPPGTLREAVERLDRAVMELARVVRNQNEAGR
jgi:hypothetical protein